VIAGLTMRQALDRAADRVLILDEAGGLSGAQLNAAIETLAGMICRRVNPGSKVGVCYWNSVSALVAHLAVERAGLTRVPVDATAAAREARAIFETVGIDLLIADAEHADRGCGEVLVYDINSSIQGNPGFEPVEVNSSSTAVIFPRMASSSGLLGVPLTFQNWEARMKYSHDLYRSDVYGQPVSESDCYLTVQQMNHGTGVIGTIPFLYLGLPQVIMKQFSVEGVIEACSRYKITTTFMVPGMVTRLAGAIGADDKPTTLTRLLYGGAPLTQEELIQATRKIGPVLVQLYGSIEGGWPLTYLSQRDHAAIAAGQTDISDSCGRMIPGIELEIRPIKSASEGRGELRVRSPAVSSSYIDPDGWCSLGDIASCDSAGYYRLHGRLDGMINTGSYHVYPAEIEEAIRDLFPVEAVVVSGEPDPKWGEVVVAKVAWARGVSPPTYERFRAALAERIAKYKIPARLCNTSASGELHPPVIGPVSR